MRQDRLEERKWAEELTVKKLSEEKRTQAINKLFSSLQEIKSNEEQIISLKQAELDRQAEQYREEFSRLRVLASTGTMINVFIHEIQALIGDMQMMQSHFTALSGYAPADEREFYEKDLVIFDDRIDMINQFGLFRPYIRSRKQAPEMKMWVIKPVVEQVVSPFKWQLRDRGIEWTNSIPETLRTPHMFHSELVSIFQNLLSNSIKAVSGTPDRRIAIVGADTGDNLVIKFLDSGKGIDKERWKEVFKPFVESTQSQMLFRVRELVWA